MIGTRPAPESRHAAGSAGALMVAATARLKASGSETSRLDARVLMAHVLGRDQAWLVGHPEYVLSVEEARTFDELGARRQAGEPVAYLVGEREFWSLPFRVTRHTLIPRPDSETLVAAALASIADDGKPLRVLDIGTGSGCLLLAILSDLPLASGVGVDVSKGALAVARDNAVRMEIDERAVFTSGDWLNDFDRQTHGVFDLVITNPPYIRTIEMASLEPDVRAFEPLRALQAGDDGLDAYRCITPVLPSVMRPGASFIGEFGIDQQADVSALLCDAGFHDVKILNDVAGRPRCVGARYG